MVPSDEALKQILFCNMIQIAEHMVLGALERFNWIRRNAMSMYVVERMMLTLPLKFGLRQIGSYSRNPDLTCTDPSSACFLSKGFT